MKEDIDILELFKKGRESIGAAESLIDNNYYDFSVGRSYYAMFYIVEALLLTKGLSFSKHSAIISSFGKEFINTGIFSEKLYNYLTNAFKIIQLGDYGSPGIITKNKALLILEQAKEFIKIIEEYLIKEGYLK